MKTTREALLSSVEAMLADIPRKIVDENSMTVDEIAAAVPCEESSARKIARDNVKSGKWEQVWKKVENRYQMSYRKNNRIS